MRGFKIWCYSIATIIILGLVGYTVHLAQKEIDALLIGIVSPLATLINVIIDCLIALIISATGLAIAYGIIYIHQHLHKHEISEIAQYGNVIIRRGKEITIAPMQVKQIAEKATKDKEIVESKPTPTLKEILINGYLPQLIANGLMLFGYTEDMTEHTGTFDDIRTCAIAGKSRYGKTVTMFLLAIQCVLSQADLTICDKHFMKDTSLTKLLEPLAKYIKFARQHNEVINAVTEFEQELNTRISGQSLSRKIKVLMIDEYTQLAMDKIAIKTIARVVQRVANEAAGYGMFCLIGGQNWQASFSGGNALVNSLHAAIVHHIDTRESSRFLDKKYAKETPKLKRGNIYLLDTLGDTTKLTIPLGTKEDAIMIAKFMEINKDIGTSVFQSPFQYQPIFTQYDPKLLTTHKEDVGAIPTTPIPPLKEQIAHKQTRILTSGENGEMVKEPVAIGETRLNSHQLPVKQAVKPSETVNPQDEQAILKAYFELGKEQTKVTRSDILKKLNWNNKQWHILKTVCDKYEIAKNT